MTTRRLSWLKAGFRIGILCAVAVGGIYFVWAISEHRSFARAVEAAASAAGIPGDQLRYPSHWPLDLYVDEIPSDAFPATVASIVEGEDSISYYLFPPTIIERAPRRLRRALVTVDSTSAAGVLARDSALVQVLWFSVDRWALPLVVMFEASGTWVEGAD